MNYFYQLAICNWQIFRTAIRLHEIKHPAMRDFAYCLLSIVYCPLPIVYCLLSIAYCLLNYQPAFCSSTPFDLITSDCGNG